MAAKKAWLTTASSPPSEATQPRRRAGFLVSSCGLRTKATFCQDAARLERQSRDETMKEKWNINGRTVGLLSSGGRGVAFLQVDFSRWKAVKREFCVNKISFFWTDASLRMISRPPFFFHSPGGLTTPAGITHNVAAPDCVWRLPQFKGASWSSPFPAVVRGGETIAKCRLNLWLKSFLPLGRSWAAKTEVFFISFSTVNFFTFAPRGCEWRLKRTANGKTTGLPSPRRRWRSQRSALFTILVKKHCQRPEAWMRKPVRQKQEASQLISMYINHCVPW